MSELTNNLFVAKFSHEIQNYDSIRCFFPKLIISSLWPLAFKYPSSLLHTHSKVVNRLIVVKGVNFDQTMNFEFHKNPNS